MSESLPRLRKRVARSDSNYSACWALVEQPSLLITRHCCGEWRVFCDRVYLIVEDPELPKHVERSLHIERDLHQYTFATRKAALQAIQVWMIKEADRARSASRRVAKR